MPDLFMTLPNENTDGGDLQPAATTIINGEEVTDFAIAKNGDEIAQLVYTILRTQAPDFSLHPTLGGNMEDLIGKPNTRATAEMGASNIKAALQALPLLSGSTIDIRVTPADKNTILFMLTIQKGTNTYTYPISFNLSSGTQHIIK